ncbi:MAG: hypothetical protein HWQ23_08815 [Nostoc sp. JL33]|uniref:hypothetical protein n=1 Tax=Nostoc sp. JL33 TaxID=2815396 RepID=UPI0025F5A169|nr:hypothetical protein [Nostoc sp. JL33]MBN3870374.1 hypothetical protein [Nostoc sp. JL33]
MQAQNKYADNPMLGMVRFSEGYIQMLRGDELSEEVKQLLDNNKNKQLKPAKIIEEKLTDNLGLENEESINHKQVA